MGKFFFGIFSLEKFLIFVGNFFVGNFFVGKIRKFRNHEIWGPPVYILLKKRFGWHLDLNWGPLGLKSNALTIT